MPDATRPTRSMFFKVLKSVISLDTSLRRITNNPGGKNLNIIFAYATSLAYDRSMHVEGPKGKTGLEVIKETEWITPKQWLSDMGWGGSPDITSYAIFMARELFNSFMQDEVMKSRGEYPDLEYKYLKELDYPSDEQIEAAKDSNKYFMLAIDDLIDLLPKSLESGKPQASRKTATFLPLWEALLGDPLSDIFRDEMLVKAKNNFPQLPRDRRKLNILEIAAGTGEGTVKLIRDLIAHYSDVTITLYCYDEIANQLNRARERVMALDKELKPKYSEKNISFQYHFHVKKYTDPITLEKDSIDLIVSFQNLHYVHEGERYNYFENLSNLLNRSGLLIIAQTTSYSHLFPHPLTLAYLTVEGFQGYPTIDEMKEVVSVFFKDYNSSAIDSIWVISNPKFK